MKKLAHLISSFVPVKKWRKKIRNNFYGNQKRFNDKLAVLHKCGEYRSESIDGITVDYVNKFKLANILEGDGVNIVSEVFVKGEYDFSIGDKVVVIDIGMNIGLASLYFASRNDVEYVYGFEPFKPTFDKAVLNFSLNERYAKKIVPYNCGLGRGNKEMFIKYNPNAPGMMSTVNLSDEILSDNDNKFKFEKVKIIDAANEISKIIAKHTDSKIVIKCDTEGAEIEIFESLDNNGLLNKVDMIMLEYHSSSDVQVCNILDKYKYAYFRQKSITLKTGDLGMIRAVRKYI